MLSKEFANNKPKVPSPSIKILLEFGPLFLFFIGYKYSSWLIRTIPFFNSFNSKTDPIFPATALFIASTLISLVCYKLILKKIPLFPLFSALLLTVFGGLTLFFHNPDFIKIKVTIIYLIFSTVLIVGLFFKKPFLKDMLGDSIHLPVNAWNTLTKRWSLFFLVLAVLNEFIWRFFSTQTWAYFKVFGPLPLSIVFLFLQIPFIMKHSQDSNKS